MMSKDNTLKNIRQHLENSKHPRYSTFPFYCCNSLNIQARYIGMEYEEQRVIAGNSETMTEVNTMKKKNIILVAAAVAALSLGAAAFAGAAKTGYTCCQAKLVCCQLKQACCNYWGGNRN